MNSKLMNIKLATGWPNNTGEPAPDEMEREAASETPPLFVELAPFLSGDVEFEKPSVASVLPGGRALFYAGRVNGAHGEPGDGKTNVMIGSSNAVLAAGGRVLYIDPEDNPQGFVRRCLGLGGDPQALAERCHYLHNPTPDEISAAQAWAREHKPELVILDGLAESLAAEGLNEDAAGDVLQFFRERIRPFSDLGAAVVVADHVAKSSESRGRWARGSGAKMGRYDGLVFSVEMGKPYTPTESGFVKLRIAKDRNGGVGAVKTIFAEVHFTPGDVHTIIEFRSPDSVGDWKPTAAMEKVREHLSLVGECSKREVLDSICMKKETVLLAISELIKNREIVMTQRGQTHLLKLAEGATVPRSPTVPQPFPENGQGVVSDRSPSSPPIGGTGNGNDAGKKECNKIPNRSPNQNAPRDGESASKAAGTKSLVDCPPAALAQAWAAVVAEVSAKYTIRSAWLEQALSVAEEAGTLRVLFPTTAARDLKSPYAKEQAALIATLWEKATGRKIVFCPEASAPSVQSVTTTMNPEDFENDPGVEAAVERFVATLDRETA